MSFIRTTSIGLTFLLGLSVASQVAAQGQTQTGQGAKSEKATAVLAGGCFWCVETDFEKLPGVLDVVSGYSGGRSKNPTYENYSSGGHREVVLVTYDPAEVTYAGLVEYLIKHIDPTNRGGQFNDKGLQYSPAVYFENQEQKEDAERVIKAIESMRVYRGRLGVAVEPREEFWPAEEYHQNYHHKNTVKYNFFRLQSGRDAFVARHWGVRASMLELPGAYPEGKGPAKIAGSSEPKPWMAFKKPSPIQLKKRLTAIQYKVTQQDGTEPAFRNEYWDNKKDGIYVDVVSGAPLFSSKDKYKSGTGWPSFVAPISREAITLKLDRKLFYTRTEVRSRYGNSHLGHVFDDGPPARGGKRYCMNSAALRFVPVEKMEEAGYGDLLSIFETEATND